MASRVKSENPATLTGGGIFGEWWWRLESNQRTAGAELIYSQRPLATWILHHQKNEGPRYGVVSSFAKRFFANVETIHGEAISLGKSSVRELGEHARKRPFSSANELREVPNRAPQAPTAGPIRGSCSSRGLGDRRRAGRRSRGPAIQCRPPWRRRAADA